MQAHASWQCNHTWVLAVHVDIVAVQLRTSAGTAVARADSGYMQHNHHMGGRTGSAFCKFTGLELDFESLLSKELVSFHRPVLAFQFADSDGVSASNRWRFQVYSSIGDN